MREGAPISKKTMGIAVAVVAALILVNSVFFTVREDRQVVVTRFGKPVRDIRDPGLYYRVPFIDQITTFDKRLLEYDASPTEIITLEKKTLVVDNFSRWRIIDPLLFLQTVRNEVGAQARLDDIIYSELRLELGRKDLLEIVATGRAELMRLVTKESDRKAREYGIEIVDVRLKRTDLPQQNLNAIFGRMKAERQRIARQYRSEGKEEAQKIRAETDRERDILLAKAYEKEQEIRGFGDAKSIDITARAFGQAPDFYSFLKSMEVYRITLKNKTTIILPTDSDFLQFLQSEGKAKAPPKPAAAAPKSADSGGAEKKTP